jgi:3-oxoacyl-[acyl-carrier-protein] synthase-3
VLTPGHEFTLVHTVTRGEELATSWGGDVSAFSTPVLLGLAEIACARALEPVLGAGQISLGLSFDIRHVAPTPLGSTVRLTAVVTKVDGMKLMFEVKAEDEHERILVGSHGRAIVDRAAFVDRLGRKQVRNATPAPAHRFAAPLRSLAEAPHRADDRPVAPTYIVGTGYFLPEDRLTNADLVASLDTTDEWIRSHTGIVERRRAPPGATASDLGAAATASALRQAGWNTSDLDLLICATSTPDALIPPTACSIGKKLEIDPVAFDVNAACSGFVYGLAVAAGMMSDPRLRRAAVCAAETYTRVVDYSDRSTAVFFGDGAGTVLLSRDPPTVGAEIVDFALANQNQGADLVTTPVGGTFRQDGRQVYAHAVRSLVDSARSLLQRNGLRSSDLTAFAGHQANLRILEKVADTLGLRPEQHWHNVALCGNQGAAGVATALCSGIESHSARLGHGDWLLLTVFGSGFTSGSALLRWIDRRR